MSTRYSGYAGSAVWFGVLLLILIQPVSASEDSGSSQEIKYQQGKAIYTEGLLPSGRYISATIGRDIKVTGEQLICSSCHRPSGMGTSEGQQVVPAVAGNILFSPLQLPTSKPPEPPVLRPAYTKETLKRALTLGVDANGDILDPFMPRYKISDKELDALISYLNTLSANNSPGVTDKVIHFSTIVHEDNSGSKNQAMLDVFETFFKQKNTETRHETKRAKNAPWHKEWMMKTYRKWKLHVWTLKGDSDTWQEQLEEFNRETPVFAVLNGVVEGSYAPIHQFCESNRIPCLFPTTMLPTLNDDDFYALYLNRGYPFEGETLASYLNKQLANSRVLHVTDINDRHAYYAAYGLRGKIDTASYKLLDQGCGKDQDYAAVLPTDIGKFDIIAVHLNQSCTDKLLKVLAEQGNKSTLFLSTRLYGISTDNIPDELSGQIRFIHTSEMPNRINRLLARSTGWFKHKRIFNPDEMEVQANAYFALKVAGDAVKHIRGYFFRDYFIEKIEHAIDDVPYTTIYPRLSLAPGQRFSSRGFYVAKIDKERGRLTPITKWGAP